MVNREALNRLPDDLVDAAVRYGVSSADRVHRFLGAFGVKADPSHPVPLPAKFAIELAAALQMLEWERAGISIHRDAGLPPATTALRDVFRHHLPDPAAGLDATPDLDRRVSRLYYDRIAWHGRRELGAEVVIDLPDGGDFVARVARYLWDNRRGPDTKEG